MDGRSTIKAIDSLSTKYPYAAAVLIYIQIERLLKNYVLEHRKSGGVFDYGKRISVGRNNKKCVQDFVRHKRLILLQIF